MFDKPAFQRAQCTDANQISFCRNETCYDILDSHCGDAVSCSSCAECVEAVVVPPNLECGLEQRKNYCDPVPGECSNGRLGLVTVADSDDRPLLRTDTVLSIGGCDRSGECTTASGRTDVYGVLQEEWSNGTAMVLPRAGAAAAKINANLGFGEYRAPACPSASVRIHCRHLSVC